MAVLEYQTLMLPVLRLAATAEHRVADVAERIADDLGLSSAEREEMLPSGWQRLLHNRIHWAKFYMSKAGLVASPKRGRFVATEAGRALLESDPARIGVNELKDYDVFRERSLYSPPPYSTVTLLAKFLGLSTSVPLAHAV